MHQDGLPSSADAADRERYHVVLDRFHAWCRARRLSFTVQMAALCQQAMGEPLIPLRPSEGLPPESGLRKPRRGHTGQSTRARTVIDLGTGQTWPSVSHAARHFGVCHNTLRRGLGGAKPFLGRRLAYAPDPQAKERAA